MSNSKTILESVVELGTGKAIPEPLGVVVEPKDEGVKLELGEHPHAIQFEFVVLGLNNFLAQHILDFIVGLVSSMGLIMAGGFHQITEAELNAVEDDK